MNKKRGLFFTCLLMAFTSSAFGSDLPGYSLPNLVQDSDVIVVGVVERGKDEIVLRVSEVLKGDNIDSLTMTTTEIVFGDEVTPVGEPGIHFLRKQGLGFAPFHSNSYKTMAEMETVRTVLDMFADPGPFLDLSHKPENSDIVFVLGEVFAGWRISSPEIPSLSHSMARFVNKYYEVGPWADHLVVTLECEIDANGVVHITSAEPKGPLTQFFEERLLAASSWSSVKTVLKTHFRVTLDARNPQKVGSAQYTDAVLYLRGRLNSSDASIVVSALVALAKLRDSDAVPLVIPLLWHEDRNVQMTAIQFLGWSQSKLAAKPLCTMLDMFSGGFAKNHILAGEVAVALEKINVADSLPFLERAACQGGSRAIEAVGAIGNTESFEAMLEAAKRDPQRCAYMVNGFYWLVRRSNKKTEEWMSNSTWSKDIGMAKIPLWVAWWDSNKKDFNVIKTQREAIEQTKKLQSEVWGP